MGGHGNGDKAKAVASGNGGKANWRGGRYARRHPQGPRPFCSACREASWYGAEVCYHCSKPFPSWAEVVDGPGAVAGGTGAKAGKGGGKGGTGGSRASGGSKGQGGGSATTVTKPHQLPSPPPIPVQGAAQPEAGGSAVTEPVPDVDGLQATIQSLTKQFGEEDEVVTKLKAKLDDAKARKAALRTPEQQAVHQDRTIAKKRSQLNAAITWRQNAGAKVEAAELALQHAENDLEKSNCRVQELEADIKSLIEARSAAAVVAGMPATLEQMVAATMGAVGNALPAPFAAQQEPMLKQIGDMLAKVLADASVYRQGCLPEAGGVGGGADAGIGGAYHCGFPSSRQCFIWACRLRRGGTG